ncbi:glycosyltransferase [Flexithrix dorotheae]|uniref:glycosyltransferase n=1 Tax=Flexithrix dorotheae TaxID=70993 RepID=UPI0003783DC7|nr:glycosyltransferase [Flexithrix dorotheae]
MKIAFLSTFYPFRGGIAQFNASLFRAIEKEHEVEAFNFTLQYPKFLFPGSSQFVDPQDNADPVPNSRLLNPVNPASFYKTYRAILKFNPDFLIIGYWMPFFAPAFGTVAWLLRKKGIKVISIINNMIPHESKPGDKVFSQYFVNNIDGFFVMGEAVKKDVLSLVPKAKILLHPHPIYTHFGEKKSRNEAVESLKIEPGKKNILFFGLIRAYKGLDLLIEAFDGLSDDYQLIIAGECYEDFSKYEFLIGKNNNKENIKLFNRYIPDHEVKDFFSAADVCVIPYKSGTQSGVIATAFYFDVPAIVTDVGNLRESVESFNTGICISSPDSSLLKTAIHDFFNNSEREGYLRNIIDFKRKFTWENLSKEIVRFYKSI